MKSQYEEKGLQNYMHYRITASNLRQSFTSCSSILLLAFVDYCLTICKDALRVNSSIADALCLWICAEGKTSWKELHLGTGQKVSGRGGGGPEQRWGGLFVIELY